MKRPSGDQSGEMFIVPPAVVARAMRPSLSKMSIAGAPVRQDMYARRCATGDQVGMRLIEPVDVIRRTRCPS